jgi:hypothetical protein
MDSRYDTQANRKFNYQLLHHREETIVNKNKHFQQIRETTQK